MQSLTHSEFSLPGSVWVCKSVSRFAKKRAGGTCREGPRTGAKWESARAQPVGRRGTGSSVLLGPRGGSAFCLLPVGQGLCKKDGDFLKPSVSVMYSGMQRKSNHLPEGGSLFRTAVSPLGSHKGKTVIGVHRAGAASLLALCTSLFEQAFQIDPAHFG